MKLIKSTLCALVLLWAAHCMFISCKKENASKEPEYIEGWTRVIGVKGTDTSSTPQMNARTETVGLLLVQDAQLKAELISCNPLPDGRREYKIEMTNKQSCQVILRWNWEGLTIDSHTPTNDVLTANQIVTYTLIGDAIPGKIKVKAEKSNNDCSNSSTLILEITTTILPIEFKNARTHREGDKMFVHFSTEAPQDVDTFFVLWTPDGNKANEVIKYMLGSDGKTKSYTISYPAVKKEIK